MVVRKPLVVIAGEIAEIPSGDFLGAGGFPGCVGLPNTGGYLKTCGGAGGSTTVLAGAANRMDIFPWVCPYDFASDLAAVNVTTAVASATGKIVLYEANPTTTYPASLLAESPVLDFSTVGAKTAALSYSFKAGNVYWLGIRHSSTAALSGWPLQSCLNINGQSPVTTAASSVRRTVTFANAAPNPWVFNVAEITANVATAIWLRRG